MSNFFCNTPDNGFETFDTEDEAKSNAQECIDYYRSEANEGWSDEVTQICWGKIEQQATEFDSKPLISELRSELNIVAGIYIYCDYELQTLT